MKITLEIYSKNYSIESKADDYRAEELKQLFSALLVCAGYPPDVLTTEDGGHYNCEYVGQNDH
jgi:hypothetical protein